MTTFVTRVQSSVDELLGLPEHHSLASLLFLGEPTRRITRLSRRPVSDFASVDRFDGPALQT